MSYPPYRNAAKYWLGGKSKKATHEGLTYGVKEMKNATFPRFYMKEGETIMIELPFSEVAIHLGVAGKVRPVQIEVRIYQDPDGGEKTVSPLAQIKNQDGTDFSFPILLGEAGIFIDEHGHYYTYKAAEDGRVW